LKYLHRMIKHVTGHMVLIIFLTSQILYSTASQGTRPIISLYAATQGASPLVVGLLVSTMAFFPMIAALVIGKWLDRYGARKLVSIGGSGMFLAILIPFIFPHIASLFISQFLIGISQQGVMISFQKTIGNYPGDRDKLIMLLTLTGATGLLIGPLLTGFTFQYFGFQTTFGLCASIVLLALVLNLLLKKEHWKSGASAKKTSKAVNFLASIGFLKRMDLRKALIAGALVFYSKELFVAYFPVYGNGIGLSASTIGIILSVSSGMALVVRMMNYWLTNHFGRSNVLFFTLLLSGACFIVIPFMTLTSVLFILSGLLGAGLALGQPISLIYTLNFTEKDRQGEVLGLRMMMNRGALFSAPLFFGAIGGLAGLTPLFLASGLFLVSGAYVTRIKKPTKTEHHDHGVSVNQ
jgi:MFS family permease